MIEKRLFARLVEKKKTLDDLRPLPETILKRLKSQLEVEWIYHSNAIEGSALTLRETQLIIEEGIAIGGKSLREHFEVINHQEAIKHVESLIEKKSILSSYQVRQIHNLVLSGIEDEFAGAYRETDVRIVGANHVPPEPWEIPRLMGEWSDWLQEALRKNHIIITASIAHHKLVAIHPFIDGNGRTARLIMNLILMQNGYPPTVIMRSDRQQYYSVLSQADAGNDEAVINFVARAVEKSLTLYLNAFKIKTGPATEAGVWILLREAAIGTAYSQEYLSLLARTGKLEAIKRGRNWYTTRQAVQAYRQSVLEK